MTRVGNAVGDDLRRMDLTRPRVPAVAHDVAAASFAVVLEAARAERGRVVDGENFLPVRPVEASAGAEDSLFGEEHGERPSRDAVVQAANEVLKKLRLRDLDSEPMFGQVF